MSVTIEMLNVGAGDKPIYIEDVSPEERDNLGKEVLRLKKQGFALFLIQGSESRLIKGYDKKEHQWILLSDTRPSPKKGQKKVSAEKSRVAAVGPTAGG